MAGRAAGSGRSRPRGCSLAWPQLKPEVPPLRCLAWAPESPGDVGEKLGGEGGGHGASVLALGSASKSAWVLSDCHS